MRRWAFDAAVAVAVSLVSLGLAVEERLRIARELHDVIGHSFAVVNVQARAAAALLDRDTDGARQALATIEETSRDALGEIRAALSTLRADNPRPVLDASVVEALLAPVRAAGLDGRAVVDREFALPTEVSHVLYRVVQESLTNVLRHAHARTVTVTLAGDGNAARVEVRDDGTGTGGTGTGHGSGGHGVTGMRERVEPLGGRLHAGPDPQGAGGSPHGYPCGRLNSHDPGTARRRPGTRALRLPPVDTVLLLAAYLTTSGTRIQRVPGPRIW